MALPAFQQAVAWLKENWPAIQATIADVWTQAQPILQAIGDFVINVLIPILNQAVQWVVTNWPQIRATIETVMTAVQQVITTILTAIQAFWNEWGDEIMAFLGFLFQQWGLIFAAFSAAFEGDWRRFGEILRTAFNNAWEAIKDIVRAALEWFMKQDWGQIGMDILRGIADGVNAGIRILQDAVYNAAKAAFDAAKGFLGIKSPSKLFEGIGGNMMAGMAQGIMGGLGAPVSAMRSASSAVTNSVTNNSGGNTYNYYGVQADTQYAYQRAIAGAVS